MQREQCVLFYVYLQYSWKATRQENTKTESVDVTTTTVTLLLPFSISPALCTSRHLCTHSELTHSIRFFTGDYSTYTHTHTVTHTVTHRFPHRQWIKGIMEAELKNRQKQISVIRHKHTHTGCLLRRYNYINVEIIMSYSTFRCEDCLGCVSKLISTI